MTQVQARTKRTKKVEEGWRVVQRVVFPAGDDRDVLALYADFNRGSSAVPGIGATGSPQEKPAEATVLSAAEERPEYVDSRRSLTLPAGGYISLGTYFNAFPASYWRRWTDVQSVRLRVRTLGDPTIVVYRSNARGNQQRITSKHGASGQEVTFDLPLTNFGDGGWYWFDIEAGRGPAQLLEAEWVVPTEVKPSSITISITTLNKPDYCVTQLNNLADAPETMAVVDEILIVDQGTKKVVDDPGYAAAAKRVGAKLRIIDQGNIGGSGGFARGMRETLRAGKSKYVLLLDDDVLVEPEGILRALAFGDLARKPTIVGGHMLNMYERTVMHTFGERVNLWRTFWGSVRETWEAHNFATGTLRNTPWLHRRADVDFNGWWMCMIPVSVVEEIGLALPVFIKWDDAEFGLRAKKHGYATVSMPGVAVWHVPWTDKDDTIDWQAYYHQRNRYVAGLLYSPYQRGGNLLKESFQVDIKHLLSLQYSAMELRLQALEDILSGPEHLHPGILTKLPEVRETRAQFPDAQLYKDPAEYPAPQRKRPPRRGKEPHVPHGRAAFLKTALVGSVRQLLPTSPSAQQHPEEEIPATDARWWRLSALDSALVSTADGTGAAWYQRQPEQFRSMLKRSIRLHQQIMREWPELSKRYRDAHEKIVSVEEWDKTFEAATPQDRA